MPFAELSSAHQDMINAAALDAKATIMFMSNHSECGVDEVKTFACDALLKARVDTKVQSAKINDVVNRLTVSLPVARDSKPRGLCIPSSVTASESPVVSIPTYTARKQVMASDLPSRVKTQRYDECHAWEWCLLSLEGSVLILEIHVDVRVWLS